MRILYVTTIGGTMVFFKSLIRELLDDGHVVDIATNEQESGVPDCYREWGCKVYSISTSRSPFSSGNIKAIKEIRNLASDYDIIHCHTPLASVATRLACKPLRKNGLKVIYTAHGFHFYKGAPAKNWILYYPMEWICAHWTDVLITINKEDYALAQKHMHAGRIEYVPGVGIDVEKFANVTVDRNKKRNELGIPKDAFLLLSVGELNKNKNHQVVIKALAEIHDPNIHYAIAGSGNMHDNLLKLSESLEVKDQLHLLGHRDDMEEIYKVADVNVFPSIREGFGLAAIEGMAAGTPTICSKNRGTLTFGIDNVNCLFATPFDSRAFSNAIKNIKEDSIIGIGLAEECKKDIKKYDYKSINPVIINVYNELL